MWQYWTEVDTYFHFQSRQSIFNIPIPFTYYTLQLARKTSTLKKTLHPTKYKKPPTIYISMHHVHHTSSLPELHHSSNLMIFWLESLKGTDISCLKPPFKTIITKVRRPPTYFWTHSSSKNIQNSSNSVPFSRSFFLYFLLYSHYGVNFSIIFNPKLSHYWMLLI